MWAVTRQSTVVVIILSTKLAKNSDDSKVKHANTNEKHAIAVVLREQWLKDNPNAEKKEWDPRVHLPEMKEKYTVKWIRERSIFEKFKKATEKKISPEEEFSKREKISVEFLIAEANGELNSYNVEVSPKSTLQENLKEIQAPFRRTKLHVNQIEVYCQREHIPSRQHETIIKRLIFRQRTSIKNERVLTKFSAQKGGECSKNFQW